jgi:heme/copper-type cytochrome/quinol oxidase subunit 1
MAGNNPWGADTLEWSAASPPPNYNFHDLPAVEGRYALWSQTEQTPVVRGLSTNKRETLVTSVLDAEPELRFEIPGPSIWPFLLAMATAETFIVGIFTAWAFAVGAVLTFAVFVGWFFGDPNYENKTARETGEQSPAPSPTEELRPKEA